MQRQYPNVLPLKRLLEEAERGRYAVGSFSPRYTAMIRPVIEAGESARSPILVQVSQIEMRRVGFTVNEFAETFWEEMDHLKPMIPVGLHLDHTYDFDLIQAAIEQGFTSVMIDASSKTLDENIAITKEVVAYAHARGVSVEAELGRIASADRMETESDDELYTDPEEAEIFAGETGVDALAVSVGTAHGVYTVRQPRIDLQRLQAIRQRAGVHLVLHGGSGVPAEMIEAAIQLPGGGVSKINIATDLETAMLAALDLTERPTNADVWALLPEAMQRARSAVEDVVVDKMVHFVGSANRAEGFEG